MAKIYSQLENAQIENKTSDYSVGTLGRMWVRSDTKKLKFDRGDVIADVLLNDDKLLIGTSGTAANNSRLYRDAVNRLSFVVGTEATAEGSAPVALSELASRLPNYTNGTKPASSASNPGRQIWLTDLLKAQIDTGTAWQDVAGAGAAAAFQWNVNGALALLGSSAKRIDGSVLFQSLTPVAGKLAVKRIGTAGTLDVDVRAHQTLNSPIKSIASLFSAAIVTITAPLATIATQSIARHTAQISTQSISRVKSTLNIQSIIKVPGTNQWKYNFTGALLDADYSIGSSVLIASATSGGNNGTFVISDLNAGGFASITVTNASGVAQTGVAGTLDLQLWSFNYSSAVSTDYVAGDSVLTASHTTGANNGTFAIYKINQAGNNIWIYIPTGAAQAGVAGNSNNFLWRYTYLLSVSSQYVAGESAKFASHTTGANNGNFPIRFVNSGANDIVVYNVAGVAQAGVAGTALPNRWNINFGSDPSAIISVGDTVRVEGGTAANNGLWVVKVLTTNTVTVYDPTFAMVAQAAAGTSYHTKYKITLSVDPAAVLLITTDSRIELKGTPTALWDETDLKLGYAVLAVGALDVTITDTTALLADVVSSPAGYIAIESKSIFSARPSIVGGTVGLFEKELQIANATVLGTAIGASTWLGVWVMSNFTAGLSRDFSITLY